MRSARQPVLLKPARKTKRRNRTSRRLPLRILSLPNWGRDGPLLPMHPGGLARRVADEFTPARSFAASIRCVCRPQTGQSDDAQGQTRRGVRFIHFQWKTPYDASFIINNRAMRNAIASNAHLDARDDPAVGQLADEG